MLKEIEAKTILNKTKRRDPWFLDDYTLNLYSGCSFNCLFCYIRGSKYGEQMERKMSVKVNAIDLLDKQLALRAKKGQYGIIVLSSATDPYLQAEAELKMTRQALEVILKHKFPVHIITRSDLIVRDLDLLQAIDKQAILPQELETSLARGVIVSFSFSTLDDAIARVFEPGATAPSARLEAMRSVKAAGLLTGVSMMPLLPWISDNTASLNTMLKAFADACVDYVLPATLTLYGTGISDSKTLVLRAVERHYPEFLEKYQAYFNTENSLPRYYQDAFKKRVEELLVQYGLRQAIIAP